MKMYYLQSGINGKIVIGTDLDALVKIADMCKGMILTTNGQLVYSYGESKLSIK